MDKNSAIGLTLIALLLAAYFYFFSPTPVPPETKTVSRGALIPKDSTVGKKPGQVTDSVAASQYGNLSSFLTGAESLTSIENDVLKLTFSNHATFSEVNLKKYKTYTQRPLNLVQGGNNSFS